MSALASSHGKQRRKREIMEQEAPKRGRPKKGEEKGICTEPLPEQPALAVGIDIGVDGFHVCVPGGIDEDVKQWRVWYISYAKTPDWRKKLRALLDERTIVVCEPTGWNYLQPIARVVCLESPAHLWLIEHSRTASVRGICGMQHKTDIMDTRALCFAAMQLHISRKFAGCWEFDWAHNEMLLELRFLVNAHYKASADRTRFNNRLHHLGHSIAPELNFGSGWFLCMEQGAFTPAEFHALDLTGMHPAKRRAIANLRANVPADTCVSPPVINAIREAWAGYVAAATRQQALEGTILKLIEGSKFAYQWERLMTYPYASPIGCASIIVATKGIGDRMRLPRFRACLGAFPQLKQSGSSFKSRAAKKGYRPAMKTLHLWAQALVKQEAPENVIRAYFAGGEKAGGKKFSAAKSKLAQVLHAVIRNPNGHNNKLFWVMTNGNHQDEL
jgi:hypothetical protein